MSWKTEEQACIEDDISLCTPCRLTPSATSPSRQKSLATEEKSKVEKKWRRSDSQATERSQQTDSAQSRFIYILRTHFDYFTIAYITYLKSELCRIKQLGICFSAASGGKKKGLLRRVLFCCRFSLESFRLIRPLKVDRINYARNYESSEKSKYENSAPNETRKENNMIEFHSNACASNKRPPYLWRD